MELLFGLLFNMKYKIITTLGCGVMLVLLVWSQSHIWSLKGQLAGAATEIERLEKSPRTIEILQVDRWADSLHIKRDNPDNWEAGYCVSYQYSDGKKDYDLITNTYAYENFRDIPSETDVVSESGNITSWTIHFDERQSHPKGTGKWDGN